MSSVRSFVGWFVHSVVCCLLVRFLPLFCTQPYRSISKWISIFTPLLRNVLTCSIHVACCKFNFGFKCILLSQCVHGTYWLVFVCGVHALLDSNALINAYNPIHIVVRTHTYRRTHVLHTRTQSLKENGVVFMRLPSISVRFILEIINSSVTTKWCRFNFFVWTKV